MFIPSLFQVLTDSSTDKVEPVGDDESVVEVHVVEHFVVEGPDHAVADDVAYDYVSS